MKQGLLEIERPSSPDQQDRPPMNFAMNFEDLKISAAPPHHGIHRFRKVTFAISRAIRQTLFAAWRLVWTIWTYRALINELDSLTKADFRDLGVRPKDEASVAWKEARRRAAERYHPHGKEPPS
jgi:uncharacterized protein YjiS (DUF1127 family)